MCIDTLFGSGGSSGPSWESPDSGLINNLVMGSILGMMPRSALSPMLGNQDSGLGQMLGRMYGNKEGDKSGRGNLRSLQSFAPKPMQYKPGSYGYNIFGGGGKPGILGTTPASGQYNILGK